MVHCCSFGAHSVSLTILTASGPVRVDVAGLQGMQCVDTLQLCALWSRGSLRRGKQMMKYKKHTPHTCSECGACSTTLPAVAQRVHDGSVVSPHTHARTHARTHTHTHLHTPIHTSTPTHTQTLLTCPDRGACSTTLPAVAQRVHDGSVVSPRTHAHTHARTHAHTRTHTDTSTHPYTSPHTPTHRHYSLVLTVVLAPPLCLPLLSVYTTAV